MKICACMTASLLLLSSLARAEETMALPERTTAVIVSNRDVNRIYCTKDVEDVVWSKEKPATVKVSGANVFVKFLVGRQGEAERLTEATLDLTSFVRGKSIPSSCTLGTVTPPRFDWRIPRSRTWPRSQRIGAVWRSKTR